MSAEPLLRVEGLTKHFDVTRGLFGKVVGQVHAVDGVSFEMMPGETLGLVGESGCGKSTVGRTLLRLIEPSSGRVEFEGKDISRLTQPELAQVRRRLQVIFQDPFSSLNPRMRVLDIVGEALEVHGVAKGEAMRERVMQLLARVGIAPSWADRYPHEFSGGQRQRVGIARALALGPSLVVCDEAVSALDVSIRAQVLNLLIELRQEFGLAYLFISHDLSVVRHLCQRTMVMYLGQVAELSDTAELFRAPLHPYTRALLSALPIPNPRRRLRRLALHGDVPTALNPPSGCRFHTRCPAVFERCPTEAPPLYTLPGQRQVRCFHAEGLSAEPRFAELMDERVQAAQQAANSRRAGAASATGPNAALDESTTPLAAAGAASGSAVGPVRKLSRLVWLVALGLVAIAAFWFAKPERARERAHRQMQALARELVAAERAGSQAPAQLGELGYRLHFVFPEGDANDPWGTPYQYEASAETFALKSLGPDERPSADDLVYEGRWSTSGVVRPANSGGATRP